MEWFVRAFMRASLGWLALGVTLGLTMAVHPAWAVFRTAHLHMTLAGFVAMMIFGVAYFVGPRFFAQPLYSRRLAFTHWWLSNLGLAGMAIGFMARGYGVTWGGGVLVAGGLLQAAGAYAFVYNVWRTISASPLQILDRRESLPVR